MLSRWLFAAGVVLSAVSQIAVVLAPLAEGRDGYGAASHVESAGTSRHYAHNEATCVTCQARLLTGLTVKGSHATVIETGSAWRIVAAVDRVQSGPRVDPHGPRAPPPIEL